MKTFDTVAKLKLAKLKEGQFVNTGGYYTKGEGGSAEYFIKTAAQATTDGDVIDGVNNLTIANSNVAIKQQGATKATKAKTWFVATTGSDTTGDSTAALPFATPQRAIDAMPDILNPLYQQSVQLSDGDYSTSSQTGASQARPAVLQIAGKITTGRSSLSGVNITGSLVIKGNPADNTAVTITTGAEFTSAIYANKGNIAFQDLTLRTDNVTQAEALVVSHRTDTYLHFLNCIVDGVAVGKAKIGASCESSGQIEWIDGKIKNAAIGVLLNNSGDNFTIATRAASIIESCTTGAVAKNNSVLSLNSLQDGKGKIEIITGCTIGAIIEEGAQMTITGQDNGTDMAQIANPVNVEGGHIRSLFSEFLDTVTIENGSLQLRQSNYQGQLLLANSDLWLKTSNSFVGVATENDNAVPIFFTTPSVGRIFDDGTNNIVGLGGQVFSLFDDTLTYTGAGSTEASHTIANSYNIVSSGGVKANSQIDATNVAEGTVIGIYGGEGTATLGVTFTDGTEMEVPTDFTIGGATGHYASATLTMGSSKWRVTGLGIVRP